MAILSASPEDLPIGDLLEAVTGSSSVREAIAKYPLEELCRESTAELRRRGFSPRAATRLACAFEIGRRLSTKPLRRGEPFRSSGDIFRAFHERMRGLRVERFLIVMVDAKNRIQRETMVSQGTLTNSLVHPREVFREAIREGAAGVILVHNHPSGEPEPSPEDIDITARLAAVGELLGIRVLDHVVIGAGSYVSFLDRRLLPA